MTKRVVLVTGGTRGIGRAIAAGFAAKDDQVIVCARKQPETCAHPFFSADLRDADACQSLISQVAEQYGRIDVLVNNAGGSPAADTATASPRFSEKIVQINLLAPLWMSQFANSVMQGQENGGVIINIASVSAMRPAPTTAAYGAAKAGLVNLTQTMGQEFAPKVRVVAISPGLVLTETVEQYYSNLDEITQTVPRNRLCTPEDVAHACVWMASAESDFITGANLVLDGGGDWPAFLRPKG